MYWKAVELMDLVSPYKFRRTFAARGSTDMVQNPNQIRLFLRIWEVLQRHPPHIGLVVAVAVTKHSKIVQATRAYSSKAATLSLIPSATTTLHIYIL